ncbi:MAG: type II toxin-antitoxin system RelE/ParE family toxin [Pseudomonadota bacterium]|nr:type II toxin-antitoxin system RelE/ParE family toxin [Pseudomonadota bacterium]
MIRSIRHKGLKLLYEDDDGRRLAPEQRDRIGRILARLDQAREPADMDVPGFRLHPLKGSLAGFWSVSVSGNLRVIFRFEGQDSTDVDLVDYH